MYAKNNTILINYPNLRLFILKRRKIGLSINGSNNEIALALVEPSIKTN